MVFSIGPEASRLYHCAENPATGANNDTGGHDPGRQVSCKVLLSNGSLALPNIIRLIEGLAGANS
jgi:hypothetical protein